MNGVEYSMGISFGGIMVGLYRPPWLFQGTCEWRCADSGIEGQGLLDAHLDRQ